MVWLGLAYGLITYIGIYMEFEDINYYSSVEDVPAFGQLYTDVVLLGVVSVGHVLMLVLQAVTIYYSFEYGDRQSGNTFFYRTLPCKSHNIYHTQEEIIVYIEGQGYISAINLSYGLLETVVKSCRAALTLRFLGLFLGVVTVPYGCYLIRLFKQDATNDTNDKAQVQLHHSL